MCIILKTLFYLFKVVTFPGQRISRRLLPLRRAVVTVHTVCNNVRSIKGTCTFSFTSPQRIKTQTVRSVELEHKEQPPFYLYSQQHVSRIWSRGGGERSLSELVAQLFRALTSVVCRADVHWVEPRRTRLWIHTIYRVDLLFEIPVLLCLAVLDSNHNTITNGTSFLNYQIYLWPLPQFSCGPWDLGFEDQTSFITFGLKLWKVQFKKYKSSKIQKIQSRRIEVNRLTQIREQDNNKGSYVKTKIGKIIYKNLRHY